MHSKTWAEAIRRLYDPVLKESIPHRLKAVLRHEAREMKKKERPAFTTRDAPSRNDDDC